MSAQIGGSNTYEFLNLTSSARIASLGNSLLNVWDDDVNLSQQLPSLNHAGMNHQLSTNFVNYYSGIRFGSVVYGMPNKYLENISIGLHFFDYGDFTQANEYGDKNGTFTAGDYALNISSAYHIDSTWHFGGALKTVYSHLESYTSLGALMDLSATYKFDNRNMMASVLVKNMGFQIKTYNEHQEPLPFELMLGISNKFEHAPFRWSITWAHLEQWNLDYVNSNTSTTDILSGESVESNKSVKDKVLSHVSVGAELLFSQNFQIRVGYNFRRRQEMILESLKKSIGLTWGFTMKVSKFHFNYARVAYHLSGPMHSFSILTNINDFRRK